ncbi:MAG: ribosomal protein [Bacteroidota bacterium]|jgi:large subunit ribosomal protein L29
MKNSEIRELSNQEVAERIVEVKAQLVKLRLNHAITPLENPNQIKNVRRTIARLITEQSARTRVTNA